MITHKGTREIPPDLCELVRNEETGQMAIHVLRATERTAWEGWAVFPDTMSDEAYVRFSMLETTSDVQALLREWAPDGVVDEYQLLRALEA